MIRLERFSQCIATTILKSRKEKKPTMSRSKVVIRSVKEAELDVVVTEILDSLRWESIVAPGIRVVIKPNLNTAVREHTPSSNTDPKLVVSVCRAFRERTKEITLVESDGPRHEAERAFAVTGLHSISEELGIEFVNLSKSKTRPVTHPLLRGFELPEIVLDADLIVTLPVLKTHALTVFSGAIKNQWGCIPRSDRILLHKNLDELLPYINTVMRPKLAIMDGIIAMEGRGPSSGKPRRLDLILGSKDIVALDATAMRLVGLDPYQARHVVLSHQKGLGEIEENQIEIDGDFQRVDFEPAVLDWPLWGMNYLTRSGWFVEYILLNDRIFYPTRRLVRLMRRLGII